MYIQRVLEAVKDERWQEFRRSLKGLPTSDKLEKLRDYWTERHTIANVGTALTFWDECDSCVQVDNYIKALCRGGQLYPRQNLVVALKSDWQLDIKR